MRAFILLSLIPSLLACGGGGNSTATNDYGAASVDLGSSTLPSCAPSGATLVPFASTAPMRSFSKADNVLEANKDYVAILETDVGCFAIDLHEATTPTTVNSFVFLTLHHYFDGIAFHRVIDGFMAQSGDPNSVGTDRSSWGQGGPGYSFGLEVTPSLNFDGAGVVGMARTNDPNSNGSQFFITFAAAHNLDQSYTVFGKLSAGENLLPMIARGEPPATPTRIVSASIVVK